MRSESWAGFCERARAENVVTSYAMTDGRNVKMVCVPVWQIATWSRAPSITELSHFCTSRDDRPLTISTPSRNENHHLSSDNTSHVLICRRYLSIGVSLAQLRVLSFPIWRVNVWRSVQINDAKRPSVHPSCKGESQTFQFLFSPQ